jgi:hypothetical protein
LDAGWALRRAVVLPPIKQSGFKTDALRSEHHARISAQALLQVLPVAVRIALLGGERGLLQVSAKQHRDERVLALIIEKGGRGGGRTREVIKTLAFVPGYAARRGWSLTDLYPMSSALAATLIADIGMRATLEASGAQGGGSVGPAFRTTLVFMATVLHFQIEVGDGLVRSAVPKYIPAKGGRRAGSLPIKLKCQLECLAKASEWSVARFYARSFLAYGLDVGMRVAEGVRITPFPDEEDPRGVIRARVAETKQGLPLELYAPASGFLGPYMWVLEHVAEVLEMGEQVFPEYTGAWGCYSKISLAVSLVPEVAPIPHVSRALFSLWTLPPLSLTNEQVKDLGVRGHSLHGTVTDWLIFIGQFPVAPFALPEDLKRGFNREEAKAAGQWTRDIQTPQPEGGGGGGGPPRQEMPNRYSGGEGRRGLRAEQLSLRRRLATYGKLAVQHAGGWLNLPIGRGDFDALVTPAPEEVDESITD